MPYVVFRGQSLDAINRGQFTVHGPFQSWEQATAWTSPIGEPHDEAITERDGQAFSIRLLHGA